MRMRASLDFWSDGVLCFCHEAVARTLHQAFDGVSIDNVTKIEQARRNRPPLSDLLECHIDAFAGGHAGAMRVASHQAAREVAVGDE